MTGARGSRRSVRPDRWALAVSYLAMPIALATGFVPLFANATSRDPWFSAWLWAPTVIIATCAILLDPPDRRSIRMILPYLAFFFTAMLSLLWTTDLEAGLAFLGRLLAFPLLYLVGWSATRDLGVIRLLRILSVAWTALIVFVFVISSLAAQGTGTVEFQRLMGAAALNLVPLFAMATAGRTYRFVLVVGLITSGLAFAANARMAGIVLVTLLLLSPAWVVPWYRRVAAGLAIGFALAVMLSLPFFGSRWFNSQNGTIWDVVGVTSNLDLSGRGEIWPAVMDRCEGSWLIGRGVGSADRFAHDFRPTVIEPHNEYLRVMCDTGVAGSAFLWSFVVMVLIRAGRSIVHRRDPAAYAALQMVGALLLVALTDNPLTATVQFFAPVAIIWAWSDRRSHEDPFAASVRDAWH